MKFNLEGHKSVLLSARPVGKGAGLGVKPPDRVQFFRVCFRDQPVDESVEFGVQNELKLIFEHVYFQKISLAYTT